MSYKDEITKKIKDAVNSWIDKLKAEHSKLHLTKQWKIDYGDGFSPGHITLPVVTGSKKGPYLIAEVEFVVPDNLELDLDTVELTLKNESFKQAKIKKNIPTPVDEPLSVINEIILGINTFLSSLDIGRFTPQQPTSYPHSIGLAGSGSNIKVNTGPALSHQVVDDVGKLKQEVKSSKYLPDWIKNISSREVYEAQYIKKGNKATLQEFFKMYEAYLKREGKLQDYCKYKSKPVELDKDTRFCQEQYCSKKPWQSVCKHSCLKFGN